jgi:hypothetical protein
MTFANLQFKGNVPSDRLGTFYVIGPQDDPPQSEEATFVHDHTLAATPQQNHGTYRVHLRSIFVLRTAVGLATGACSREDGPGPAARRRAACRAVHPRAATAELAHQRGP